jgi:hypothetical protein
VLPEQDQDSALLGRPDRRTLLKAAAVTGGAVWAAPAIMTLDAAAASTCCTDLNSPVQLITSCQPAANQGANECQDKVTNTITICRQRGQQMLFSRDALGTSEPYADELVVLTVVPPPASGGTTQIQNFIRWQNFCRNPANTLPDHVLTSNAPCGTTTLPAVDITSMFGAACGIFTITALVRNTIDPFAWSTMWIFPV